MKHKDTKDTESIECPVGGPRGGRAVHLVERLLEEAAWGVKEGPKHGDGRGQPGRWSRWRGWHSVEGRLGSRPPARPAEPPADGRGMLSTV